MQGSINLGAQRRSRDSVEFFGSQQESPARSFQIEDQQSERAQTILSTRLEELKKLHDDIVDEENGIGSPVRESLRKIQDIDENPDYYNFDQAR